MSFSLSPNTGIIYMQTMKDPAVVGEYDALLTFADRKAERFFSTHGFSDDPILTAKYRSEDFVFSLSLTEICVL